jgi:predicted dehydrogenase
MKPKHSASVAEPVPLRIGILGCAGIAHPFARDLALSHLATVSAVASRDASKAASFAATHRIARHHGNYEALLNDAQVDAVYIPLPNSLHAEWAIKAAQAGKHVLCEKPLALGRSEAQAMFNAAQQHGVMLLEAFPYYFQPQTGDMLALLQSGAIGEVQSAHASFGFMLKAPVANAPLNIRLNPDLGGGALLDVGCYALSLIRLVMGEAPAQVQAHASFTASGVDISLMATLLFADGRRAQLSCAMNAANHRHASIVGTCGTLQTEYLNHTSVVPTGDAFGYVPSRMQSRVDANASGAKSAVFKEITSPTGSGFRFAAEAFAKVIAEQDFAAVARAAQASLDNAATLEAIARSARSGLVETVSH